MANFLTIFVVPLMVALIWQFVATLLMRLLGVRLPFNLFGKERKRALQLLTFSQSVWEGVLSFGIGMLICMTLFEYLNCRFGNARCPDFSMKIRFYVLARIRKRGFLITRRLAGGVIAQDWIVCGFDELILRSRYWR